MTVIYEETVTAPIPEIAVRPADEISQVLARAADLCAAGSWNQENYCDHLDSRCAVGWIMAAAGVDDNDAWKVEDYCDRVLDALGVPSSAMSLEAWNDNPGTTKEMVVAALRTAALLPPTEEQ